MARLCHPLPPVKLPSVIRWSTLLYAAGLLCLAAQAPAHHSFAAEFDINQSVELHGRVLKVELTNPHSWIHLQVQGRQGVAELWLIEGGHPNQLLRKGFTRNSLPVGSELHVKGYRARDGKRRLVGHWLQLANGQPLFFQPAELPKPPRRPPASAAP